MAKKLGLGGVSPMPDYFWLGNCLAQPKVGQREGKASTHQLSNVWHVVHPHTKWYLTHSSSLTQTMAFPYKGHPEHTSSDRISVPMHSLYQASICHSVPPPPPPPYQYQGHFSLPAWPHETEHSPLKGMYEFYKR